MCFSNIMRKEKYVLFERSEKRKERAFLNIVKKKRKETSL